jgi:hypothetical protein
MGDAATPIVIELAKLFFRLVLSVSPNFDRAFLRCQSDQNMTETKGSYVEGPTIEIIDAMGKSDYFNPMGKLVPELFAAFGRDKGVLLLIVDKTFDYNFDFDWHDLTRWRITKLGGGTGVPEGIDLGNV